MAFILNIETSTKNCSVSVSENDTLVSIVEEASLNYSHGERLHSFIEKALFEAAIQFKNLDAIAVSKGPGSYTGLRIGVSSAKGLCFALDKPLISIETLEILSRNIEVQKGYIIPMLDARRMEVYASVYNKDYKRVREIKAEIIHQNSFLDYSNQESIYLVGDGVEKCKTILSSDQFEFNQSYPSAKKMVELSYQKWKTKDFEDLAYFEPYYLKDFIVTPQKKLN